LRKTFIDIPKIRLSEDELKASRRYRRLPLRQKLAMLDRMRSFMFELWKSNPSLRRDYERNRKLFSA